ncbi:MAG TPA: SHOCT domain-containing protein [Gaiellaceae bacterium]|nr:SHOCT domain-containing protein [Gaiellaceae bacterium]
MADPTPPSNGAPSGDRTSAVEPAASQGGGTVKHHPVLVWTLIVLAALIGFVFTLSTWANRQVLDTNSWTKSSGKLLQDPQIRTALSVYITNQLYDNVDIQGQLQKRLPPQVAPLAGPIAAGLRQPAQQATDQLLNRPGVQALWAKTNRTAHKQFIAIVENKTTPGVSTANGNVTLDLSPMLTNLGQQVGLPSAALDRLPPNAGKITVLRSSQLSWVQTGVRVIKAFSIWLIIVDFLLWGLAIYLAAGARRVAVRDIGWSIVVLGVLLLLARHALGNYVVNAVTTTETKPAGKAVWSIMTGILGDIGWACFYYGLAVVAAAILAGPTSVGTAIRRWIAPMLNRAPVLSAGVVTFAYILLVSWGPTHALRSPIGILIFAVLIAFGFYLLRRQTLAEFPDAAARATAMATSAGAALRSHRPSFAPTHAHSSVAAELERLGGLKTSGVLSDEEFQRAKEKVLA